MRSVSCITVFNCQLFTVDARKVAGWAAYGAPLDVATDDATRLNAFVAFHIRYHIERRADVVIANLELRSLSEDYRADVVTMRSQYEANLRTILADGVQIGSFAKVDLDVAAYAIIAMLTGVCFWYRPDGRLSIDEIIEVHQQLVLNGVGSWSSGQE